VIKDEVDPTQRTPLQGVTIEAITGTKILRTKSEPSGFFSLTLNPGPTKGEPVVLKFDEADYRPLEISTTTPGDQLYVARMEPLQAGERETPVKPQPPGKIVDIRSLRVRYLSKEESTFGVGSLAKQFLAYNTGNVPCRGQQPCSPDGRWKATRTSLALDAEAGNEFRRVRLLCVSGPCAFTKVESGDFPHPSRKITVSVLDWSDTTDFLVEADVVRTMVTDAVQQAYPFIVGETMSFALPPGSEGPSVEADVDGQLIVFPLGPDIILPWATCSREGGPEGEQIYRCQIKSGYRVQE
jgi:hypothetical protein